MTTFEKSFEMEISGATVERETEKAVMLDVTVDSGVGLRGRKVWFPKSQIEIVDGKVFATSWIIAKKNEQVAEEIASRSSFPKGQIYGICTSYREAAVAVSA